MEIGIIEAPTVKELFIGKIAGMIISGQLKPGEKLPSERELAAQAHISKSAVHLAMAELERLGFVKTNERQGIYVCDFTRTGTIETLNLLINYSKETFLDPRRIEDMLEMRMAIEGNAISALCGSMTEEVEARLEEDIQKSKEIAAGGDIHALAVSFFDFHHDICHASGNFIIPLLFNSFRHVTLTYWELAIPSLGKERCIELMHGLVNVLKERDAEKSRIFLKEEFDMFLSLAKQFQ